MTDKSPTPPDRPDPHLDPSDDTDEPAFDWMKPAAAGKPTAGTAAGPAGSAAAASKAGPAAAAGKTGSAAAAGSAEGTAAPSATPTASQPESRADRKAAEAAATGPSDTAQSDVATSNAAPSDDKARGAGAGVSAGARPDTAPEDEVERRNAERRNAEREQAAKAKPVLPRVLQVLLAVFYPVILLVLAVRAVTSPLFLWVEYNRPGFPGDGYGFSTDDRMTYGSYAVDYLSNWSGPRYLGDLVDQSGERLFKDGEVSHMADVKAVILSTFGAGTLLILLGLVAVIYLKRRHNGGVRRGLFAGSIVTLALIIGLGNPRGTRLGAVLHRFPPYFLRQRDLDIYASGHPDPALPGPVLDGRRDRHRKPRAARFPGHPRPDLAHAPAPRPRQEGRRHVQGHRY